MKKITRFEYLSLGVRYRGCLPGHLVRSSIQTALLAQRRGCSEIFNIRYETILG